MPKISVIVPVYKVEAYLARCVDSILAQSFAEFELILVDDGSPDNCGALCDEYAKKDPRIVVIHQKNGGLSAARNAGIDWSFANSDSQWLNFIDSDDWVHPEYLERLLNAALDNDVSISICSYARTEGEDPTITPQEMMPKVWETEAFFVEHSVNATIACAKLYRKECFENIRYPLGKIHEDEFTTYKILFRFPTVAAIAAPLYNYYVNTNGIIRSGQGYLREDLFDALDQQIAYLKEEGLKLACRSQVRKYLEETCYLFQKLSKDPNNKKYIKKLKRRRRRALPLFLCILDLRQHNDAVSMTIAFPKGMQIYWTARAILQKLKIIR